jgi:hypothetical protein
LRALKTILVLNKRLLYQPLAAIKAKATGTTISSSLSDTDLNAAANAAAGKSAALVFITGMFNIPFYLALTEQYL